MEIIDSLNEAANNFESKYGLELTLKANLAAINKMLTKRGKGLELLETFKQIIDKYEEKVNKEKVEQN